MTRDGSIIDEIWSRRETGWKPEMAFEQGWEATHYTPQRPESVTVAVRKLIYYLQVEA